MLMYSVNDLFLQIKKLYNNNLKYIILNTHNIETSEFNGTTKTTVSIITYDNGKYISGELDIYIYMEKFDINFDKLSAVHTVKDIDKYINIRKDDNIIYNNDTSEITFNKSVPYMLERRIIPEEVYINDKYKVLFVNEKQVKKMVSSYIKIRKTNNSYNSNLYVKSNAKSFIISSYKDIKGSGLEGYVNIIGYNQFDKVIQGIDDRNLEFKKEVIKIQNLINKKINKNNKFSIMSNID
ncbi:hypothetical protein FPHOBKDP_00199 [Listeria phage LPJP1]|nr:hypothetical protein FPHOBKDP_00199 [Listeria phage LPJP1]